MSLLIQIKRHDESRGVPSDPDRITDDADDESRDDGGRRIKEALRALQKRQSSVSQMRNVTVVNHSGSEYDVGYEQR